MIYNDVRTIEAKLKKYLAEEELQAPADRFSILMSQIGTVASHYNHDPELNPTARAFKTRAGETGDIGHALLNLIIYGISRDISIPDAINSAFAALDDKTWKARISDFHGTLKGVAAVEGRVIGIAFVDPFCQNLEKMPAGSILIAEHPDCKTLTPHMGRIAGIITDHGGISCHAVIVSREWSIPCIVDTGNATLRIAHGNKIMINGEKIMVDLVE